MKLRFQVTIVGRRILKLQLHFTLQRGGVIRWFTQKSSQIGVATGRKTKSAPTIVTTPLPWLQVGLVYRTLATSSIIRHGPYTSSLWTRVLPTRLLILWLLSLFDYHYNTFNAITASGVLASGDNLSNQLFTLLGCSKWFISAFTISCVSGHPVRLCARWSLRRGGRTR